MSVNDPALDALLFPFDTGLLAWPQESALFLRAREGVALHARRRFGLVCEQGFRPAFEALQRGGFEVREEGDDDGHALVLVLPPRQRDEARALLARAFARARPGGLVVAAISNDEGAKSGQVDFARLAGECGATSKHKCRVFWAVAGERVDRALLAEWAALDAPRPMAGGRFVSRPGVFAWDRIDAASALLAEHLPPSLAGHGADLGAGYGFLSAEVLARCPGVTALDVVEAESRALACACTNLAPFAAKAAIEYRWHDVTTGLPGRYDFIVSNPPFHAQGRDARPDIGRAFIVAASAALRPGGQLWLVANRHLPYEEVLTDGFGSVRTVAQRNGFKVVHAERARR